MGEYRSTFYSIQYFGQKTKGKRAFVRPRRRWKDIRTYLREIEWEWVEWIHLAQKRHQWRAVVNTVMNLQVT
jgi:hypothetical protein